MPPQSCHTAREPRACLLAMIHGVDPRRAVEPPISAQVHTLDPDRDRALFVRAERQHAMVAHRQLVALGFSRHAIAHLVERHQLRVMHRGVYAVGPARPTREARWMAAVLAVGPGAVLSHRSAAALWRLLADDGRAVHGGAQASRSRRHSRAIRKAPDRRGRHRRRNPRHDRRTDDPRPRRPSPTAAARTRH